MQVDESGPLPIDARVLKPPTLKYGPNSKQPTIVRGNPLSHELNLISRILLLATVQRFLEHVSLLQFNN